jgi:hypothetical protein
MSKNKKLKKTNKYNKRVNYTFIERCMGIATFVITLFSAAIIPIYNYNFKQPEYYFVLNNPVGWTKGDDIFSVYNYSDTDIKNTIVYIRAYMILSSNTHENIFDDYLSENSKSIPLEGLDMRFQLTGQSKDKIGHIVMDKENNPFSNYFANNHVEFGPNLDIDISSKLSEKGMRIYMNNISVSYDKMNIVIFTIFDSNESSFDKDLNKIKVYATDYATDYGTGESRTKLVDTKTYFERFEDRYSYDYGKYYRKENYDSFWNDNDLTQTIYNKFIDEIIIESLPYEKRSLYSN